MGRDEIELEVEKAIISAVLWITRAKEMHFSLVPSKPREQEGLGITSLPGYGIFLRKLFNDYLPQKAPYKDFVYPRGFADRTYNEPLRVLRYELTELLYARAQNPMAGAKARNVGARRARTPRNSQRETRR